jgi:hypothetical protein
MKTQRYKITCPFCTYTAGHDETYEGAGERLDNHIRREHPEEIAS